MDNKVDHRTSNGPSRFHDLIVGISTFVSRRAKLTCKLELGGLLCKVWGSNDKELVLWTLA